MAVAHSGLRAAPLTFPDNTSLPIQLIRTPGDERRIRSADKPGNADGRVPHPDEVSGPNSATGD
jgi:hypothetical protein